MNQISHNYSNRDKENTNVETARSRGMSSAKHFHVAGYVTCGYYTKAKNAVTGLAILFPTKIVATIQECNSTFSCLVLDFLLEFQLYYRFDANNCSRWFRSLTYLYTMDSQNA